MMLRSRWFVLAVVLLGFSQQVSQRGDIKAADSSSREARGDLLEQPAVAVWIAEGSEREVGAPLRITARLASVGACANHKAIAGEMEHLTDLDPAFAEIGELGLGVIDHEECPLSRSGSGGRKTFDEQDGARRSGWCHLNHTPVAAVAEVSIDAPSEAFIKALGAIDITHWDHDDLEFRVDGRCARCLRCAFSA